MQFFQDFKTSNLYKFIYFKNTHILYLTYKLTLLIKIFSCDLYNSTNKIHRKDYFYLMNTVSQHQKSMPFIIIIYGIAFGIFLPIVSLLIDIGEHVDNKYEFVH